MLKLFAAYFIGVFLFSLLVSIIMSLTPHYRYMNWLWHKWRVTRATRTAEAHISILLYLRERWYPETELTFENINLKNKEE